MPKYSWDFLSIDPDVFIWSLCYIVHGIFAQHLTVSRKSLERDAYIANGIIRVLEEQWE